MKNAIFIFVICAIAFSGFFFIFNAILPFLISFIIAYTLKPAIGSKHFGHKISRTLAAYSVVLIFFAFLILTGLILIPLMYEQIAIFIAKIPEYKSYFYNHFITTISDKMDHINPVIGEKIKDAWLGMVNSTFSIITFISNNIWHYTLTTINTMVLILLIPIILFYFLRDWNQMSDKLIHLIPDRFKTQILAITYDIDHMFSAYIRGQLNICLIIACVYSIGLSIIGIDVALLLGVVSGFLIIIPFIGICISFSIAMLIGYMEFTNPLQFYLLVGLYSSLHILESYIISPKIIGDRIGLHPLWIMFSVLANGSLFSITGILFAIPIAGIIKILLSHAIKSLKLSS